MIAPGAGVRVYLACGVTDMRKGIAGLAAHAQLALKQNPASGAVFCFRGRRGDRLKLLFWDGQGFCLYYKALEKGRFRCGATRFVPEVPPAPKVSESRTLKGGGAAGAATVGAAGVEMAEGVISRPKARCNR